MTNKIINGVDVSECVYFNSVTYEEPYCNIDQEHLYTCSSDENCYFKQLKRLQEENKKLKNKNNNLIEEIASGNIDIAILQKENEELRQVRKNSPDIQEPYVYLYRQIKKQCHKLEKENEKLKQENEELNKMTGIFSARLMEKYKQALEKIRKILESEC